MSRTRNDAYEENVLRALEARRVTVYRFDWPLAALTYIAGISTGALVVYFAFI